MNFKTLKILSSFFIIISFLSSCSKSDEIPVTQLDKKSGPDEIIDSLTIITISKDSVEWKMSSKLVKKYNQQKVWTAYEVFVESLEKNNQNFYQSDSAYISEVDDVLTGMGNVIITSPNGILKTRKIEWDRKTNKIHAPGYIYLKRDDNELTGTNLFTNINFDYVDLKNVSGHGTIKEDLFE
ncbi:MAG: LPS export ABC transporter periplasmic protein LptC [Candidatus Cloacimonetes bacterium]|nr:LPS export ABC transporter periplasmic protein LptC [Candidatus Cloacimonadota bacterium]MDD4155827.1 LPS export ABC transporter periplasmic protein LptC [Candidatus Cloacimonadota bacterium]